MGKVTQNFVNNLPWDRVTATISSGSLSSIVDCTKYQLVGIYTPVALTGTSLTFSGSTDGTNFFTIANVDGSGIYTVTINAERYIPLDVRVFAGLQYVRLISNANELASRNFICIQRPVS